VARFTRLHAGGALPAAQTEADEALALYDRSTWKFRDAGNEFRRAEKLNPKILQCSGGYAGYLGHTGRFKEAMD
jgi:Tfp pilus assembly protein PilF